MTELIKLLTRIAKQDEDLTADQWAQGNIDVLCDTLDEALTHFHAQQNLAADCHNLEGQERADFLNDHASLIPSNNMGSPLPALLKMILAAHHQNEKLARRSAA